MLPGEDGLSRSARPIEIIGPVDGTDFRATLGGWEHEIRAHVDGADLRAASVASCLLGAFLRGSL